MVAGLVVTTAMNPLDVISTRLYTQGTGVTERYKGPLDCAAKTVRTEGFRGVSYTERRYEICCLFVRTCFDAKIARYDITKRN